MKKSKRNWLIGLISAVVIALIAVGVAVHASNINVKGLDGSDATVTNGQGQEVDPSQLPNDGWISYNVNYNWSIPDSTNISAGDTATVTLPAGMVANKDMTGNLVDSKGQVVGTVKFTKGSSTGTITFNNVLHNQYGKHGTLSITAVKDAKPSSSTASGTSGSTLPQWGINKAGWIDSNSEKNGVPTKLYWDIVINPQGKELKDVKVTDTIGQGQTYDNGSATFYTVSYANGSEQRTGTTTGKVTVSGNQVTFDLGNIDSAIEIKYETNITDIDKNGGNIWYNQAKVTTTSNISDWSRIKDSATVNWGAGGTVQSYEGKMEITKVDSRDTTKVLPGATFELKNEIGQVIKTGLTTDANGKITVDDLPDGKYQLIETQAPAGYQLDSTPVTVIISENNNHTATAVVKDQPLADTPINDKSSSSVQSSSITKPSSSKILSSSEKSSIVKRSSIIKSSSSKISSSSKKSSSVKSSSSKKSSVESSSKEVASSSSMKSATFKSHRSGNRPVKSSSSVESSSSINTQSSSTINTVSSSSANKPSKNTETSVKVPSKASTVSYVNKSTEKSVPVTVSSETNTMVASSISSAVRTGSGSSSFGNSMINKPTLVSSSVNVPATSWSKENVNGSSATTVGTTVITYSQSELPNKGSKSESISSKPTANTATTQHTTVINNNNHSPKQGGVAVAGNNNSNGQSGQTAQSNKSGKGNGHGEGLPQTGEAAATAAVGLGIVLIAISGIVVFEKKN